jgi:subfamily B ATP-binding cassette protein MsbA
MHDYLRLLRRIRPYRSQVAASVVLSVLFSLLSTASIVMIQPFLKTLFFTEGDRILPAVELVEPAPALGGGASSMVQVPPGMKAQLGELRHRADAFLMRGTKTEALWRIVWVFFFLFLAKNTVQYLGSITIVFVGQRLIKDLRDALFDRFTRLPLEFFHRHRAGELISRATNDVQIAQKCVNVSVTNLVRDPIMILTFLGVCLSIDWMLTVVSLTVLPLSTLVVVAIGRSLRRSSRRQQERLAGVTSVLHETIYGIRVIKAFAMEAFERRRFLRESDHLFREIFKVATVQRLSSPLSEQISVLVGLFILWLGGRQVLGSGELAPDLFITFLVCLFSMVHPIKALSEVNAAIQEGMAAAERIFEILDLPSEDAQETGAIELPRVAGKVEFQGVSFAYRPGEPVLRSIDLTAEPGEVVALVGSSGAGKSTLVDMIPRFYDPQQGRILVDGIDVREISLQSLRRSLGIVTQEVILFNDTVRNNIAYGLEEVDQDALEAAACAANAQDFILQLPNGYDTLIGDRGTQLSGGQRQRLSIARAILKNPPILILDEATSALDTESEQLVQEAIERLVCDRTTFVIAHRLSTIQGADCIYVLKDGRIVEQGTHAELLARGRVYADLHSLQFRTEPAD